MKIARIMFAVLLSAALPLPAFAQPHVIAELGSAPLLGQITSTPQLQADVSRQRALFENAGLKLGLTPDEFSQFATRIAAKQLTYVTVPRHLDAMSWASGGQVHVVRDVIIPARTKGWEVDLREGNQVLAIFVPARCANLSLLRRSVPMVAKAARPHPVAVAAAATAPPQVAAPPPAPAPAVAMPAPPAATPMPYQSVAASTPPAHRMGWWPLLLIPIVALLAGHGGSSVPPLNAGTPPGGGGPPPVGPTPPPVVCPTASP